MTTCPFCTSNLLTAALTCPTCGASLTSPALEIGTVIGGKYRIERVLGQGGFGITYLALDTSLDHRVAIKELFPDGSTRRESNVIQPIGLDFIQTKQRFLEESRVVQRFNVAGIVRVYGVFEGNQTAYMVMEALSGATLTADVLENGAFPVSTVLELARQLCASLEIVHEADLLHRDIKPDNVFLSSDGRVVLIDFGSARGFAQGQVKRLTRLVTPGYAAPEQYASQAAFGTYTDVYGLAATLYYAVEGQMPPMATDLMLGARLKFKHAGSLQAGLEAGLRVKVDERPQTVRDLLQLLEQPVTTIITPLLNARVPAFLYDQNGISISTDEIIIQGKSFSVLSFKGYELTTRAEKRFPNMIIEKIATISQFNFIIGIFLTIGVVLFSGITRIHGNIIFAAFMISLGFTVINIWLYNYLTGLQIDDFEAKFSLVMNANQVNRPKEFEFLKTESRHEAAQLELALLKVIPKIS